MQQLTNLQELEMAVNLNGEVVVTKNNKNNVILMSMEEYKKSLIKDKIKNNLIKRKIIKIAIIVILTILICIAIDFFISVYLFD